MGIQSVFEEGSAAWWEERYRNECAYSKKAKEQNSELLNALKQSQYVIESIYHLTGNKEALPYMERNAAAIANAEGK